MPGLETPDRLLLHQPEAQAAGAGRAFGALAIGISAFQTKLSDWAQGGPVAIHGTNQPELIGKAVSHGCVRMHDKDVLKVSDWCRPAVRCDPEVAGGGPAAGVGASARGGLPVLALVQLHVLGLALGADVRGGLLEEEELAAALEAGELVDMMSAPVRSTSAMVRTRRSWPA